VNQPPMRSRTRDVRVKSKWVRYEGVWYKNVRPTNFGGILREAQQLLHPEANGNPMEATSDQQGEEVVAEEH